MWKHEQKTEILPVGDDAFPLMMKIELPTCIATAWARDATLIARVYKSLWTLFLELYETHPSIGPNNDK